MRAALSLTIVVISLVLFGCKNDGAQSSEKTKKFLGTSLKRLHRRYQRKWIKLPLFMGLELIDSPATLVYQFRVELGSESIGSLIADRERQALNYYCSQPAIAPLRDLGVSFEYNYSATDMTYLFSVTVGPNDCKT